MSYDEQRISDQIDGGLHKMKEMEKKITAVQWLINHWTKLQKNGEKMTWQQIIDITNLALQMEREQIEEAAFKGVQIGVMNCSYDKIENVIECDYSCAQKECSEYYAQTFKP